MFQNLIVNQFIHGNQLGMKGFMGCRTSGFKAGTVQKKLDTLDTLPNTDTSYIPMFGK